MRTLLSLLAAFLLFPCLLPAQGKVISVMGSSTAYGSGASDGHSWVELVQAYYQNLGLLKERIHNVAWPGTSTFNGMPTGFVPPPGHGDTVMLAHNVDTALSFNPDVVIVAYAGNDLVDNYSIHEMMSNLHTIYDTITGRGKICWITTTQPRDALPLPGRMLLKAGRDSILAQFSVYGIDFWTPVAELDPNASNYLGINPILAAPNDGIHLNDSGHAVLAKVIESVNLFGTNPLAITLLSFTAAPNGKTSLLNWTTTEETAGSDYFIIQRSADATTFQDLARIEGTGRARQTDYSWTDPTPLAGKSFYRLMMVAGDKDTYSKIVGLLSPTSGLAINKLFLSGGGSQLQAEINVPNDQLLTLTVINALGVAVRQQIVMALAPSQKVLLSIAGLAAGQYFLKVTAANGEHSTRGFLSMPLSY